MTKNTETPLGKMWGSGKNKLGKLENWFGFDNVMRSVHIDLAIVVRP